MAANTFGTLIQESTDLLTEAVALRRRIHERPELGLDLPATQAAILEAMEDLKLPTTIGSATTSVVATLEGARPGPTLLLRGDMDALPLPEDTGLDFASKVDGAMHACGHDAHVAMLAGAARLLAAHTDELAGRVVFMFQPGEEGHGGAQVMIDEGLLDQPTGRIDGAFAIHQTPSMPLGSIGTRGGALLASADTFDIVVRGQGGHASQPHFAVDPIPVACEIVTALQAYVTRRVDAFDPAVVTIGRFRAGTTSNVIPETAELLGTIRTVSDRTRTQVMDGVKRVAEGIASAHGADVTVDMRDGYPVTINDDGFAGFVRNVATDLVGERLALHMPNPVMGAEDWSYVLQQVPGAMAFLGTRPSAEGRTAPNHSNRMVIDESAMVTGIGMYAAVALRFLSGQPIA
jgi:hippurate hydrolase